MNSAAGIYIHVPFCKQKCPYCDFYSITSPSLYDEYTEAVLRAVASCPFDIEADTLYFGGGTPSLLGASRLVAIKEAAFSRFSLDNRSEVTLEANPGAVDFAMLESLSNGGFNRIAFGVQSLNDNVLKVLGRIHSAKQAADSILAAREAGFKQISADLMLAVPTQTIEDISASIAALAALSVEHISAYLLKVEPKTAFGSAQIDVDDDFAADCYLAAAEQLSKNGFLQYEISNFAKDSRFQSRHNLKYWNCEPYLGIGPAAHSFIDGRRFYFERDLAAFCSAPTPWELRRDDGEGGGEDERIMLGLRLNSGIDLSCFSPKTQERVLSRIPPLEKAGLVNNREGVVSLTVLGALVSNSVISRLLL